MQVQMKSIPRRNSKSPIFSYCRKLIEDGVDPNESLEIYRKDIKTGDWDVRIPNIGEVAKWTVREAATSGPTFVKYKKMDPDSLKKLNDPRAYVAWKNMSDIF